MKTGSDNFRASVIKEIMKQIKSKRYVYELTLKETEFYSQSH